MDDLKYISFIDIGQFFSLRENQTYDGNYWNVSEWKFDQNKASETWKIRMVILKLLTR